MAAVVAHWSRVDIKFIVFSITLYCVKCDVRPCYSYNYHFVLIYCKYALFVFALRGKQDHLLISWCGVPAP